MMADEGGVGGALGNDDCWLGGVGGRGNDDC